MRLGGYNHNTHDHLTLSKRSLQGYWLRFLPALTRAPWWKTYVITPERNLGHMEEEHGGVAFIRNHTLHTHGHFKISGFPLGILSNHGEQVRHFKDKQLKQKGSICLSPWFPSLDRTLGVGGKGVAAINSRTPKWHGKIVSPKHLLCLWTDCCCNS